MRPRRSQRTARRPRIQQVPSVSSVVGGSDRTMSLETRSGPNSVENPPASPDSASPLVDVRGVTLQYKTSEYLVTATFRVDFQVFRSERFILLGPSGCGKSTLLKAVGGYLQPVEGEIR